LSPNAVRIRKYIGLLSPAVNPRFLANVFKATPKKIYVLLVGVIVIIVVKSVVADTSITSEGTEVGRLIDGSLILNSLLLQVRASTEDEDVAFDNTTSVSLSISSDDPSPVTLIRFPSLSHAEKSARQNIMNVDIFVFIRIFPY
jgi:hypothetical protein